MMQIEGYALFIRTVIELDRFNDTHSAKPVGTPSFPRH